MQPNVRPASVKSQTIGPRKTTHGAEGKRASMGEFCQRGALAGKRIALLASASLLVVAAAPAVAQTASDQDARQQITVLGERKDYKADQNSISKLTQPLLDTPQSITTVTEQLIDDRGAATLNDALRNVPGISLGAGEFSWQGTNLTLRGFNARNDIYLDGMRDFGSYYRDTFNLEEVQVL